MTIGSFPNGDIPSLNPGNRLTGGVVGGRDGEGFEFFPADILANPRKSAVGRGESALQEFAERRGIDESLWACRVGQTSRKKINPPAQQAFRKTPALYIVNLLHRKITPEVAQGIDRLLKGALMIGDKRRVDGAGGNAGQYGDAQVGKTIRKAAQKPYLVGGMGPSATQYERQIVIAVGHRLHLLC